jgi:hypothetical protein
MGMGRVAKIAIRTLAQRTCLLTCCAPEHRTGARPTIRSQGAFAGSRWVDFYRQRNDGALPLMRPVAFVAKTKTAEHRSGRLQKSNPAMPALRALRFL